LVFETIINSRKLLDFKFDLVSKTKDSIRFSIKNKTNVYVPVPVYGTKKEQLYLANGLTYPKSRYHLQHSKRKCRKIILNLNNEVPEFNLRNNWRKLNGFFQIIAH